MGRVRRFAQDAVPRLRQAIEATRRVQAEHPSWCECCHCEGLRPGLVYNLKLAKDAVDALVFVPATAGQRRRILRELLAHFDEPAPAR